MSLRDRASSFRVPGGVATWVVWIVAVQVVLLWIYHVPEPKQLLGDEVRYAGRAEAILGGGPWHVDFLWPPGQPVFLAAVVRLFGVHRLGVQVVQLALLVACALMLRGLWRRAGGSPAAATLAACLFLAHPSIQAYAHYLWPEVPHLFLTLLSLWLPVRFAGRVGAAAGAGAALGLALLFKSLWTAAWPLWMLLLILPQRLPEEATRIRLRWRPVGQALAFVVALGLVTAPAWWHGLKQTGRPMIADSSMLNLWIGLHDEARSDYSGDRGAVELEEYLESGETLAERRAVYRQKIRHRVAERGLLRTLLDQLGTQYHRLFSAKTLLVSQLPGPRCRGHVPRYRDPPGLWVALLVLGSHALHVVTLLGFALGLAGWRRWRIPLLWLLLALVGYQLALFLGLHVKTRYVLPLWPVLCGFAGSALVKLVGVEPAGELRFTRRRVGLGIALGILLLWLAFSGPYLDGNCAG